jgi:hemolysin D
MKFADAVALSPRTRSSRSAEELAFLPAALEIVETPPPPLAGAVGAAIIALFCLALVWTVVGRLDIIATAQGKIVPTGRTKTVQPLEAGIVRAILARDGDHVTAGEILIELDQTVTRAERARTAHDLMMAKLDVARLTALRAQTEAIASPIDFTPPPDAPEQEVRRTRAATIAQAQQQAAKVAAVDQQIAQKAAEGDETQASIAKLEASLPLIEEEAMVRRKAKELAYGNQIAYLEAQTRLIEQQQELVVQKRHLAVVTAARQALERQRDEVIAQYTHDVLGDLADAEQKSAEFTQDLIKAERKMDEQLLRAPVDGTVQQLAVHTVGGVVTPAQQLMMIVPADSHLEAEAMVSNRDIGFVHLGETAEIKIDTFNFTRYGLLHGEVLNVSQDAIVRDKPADKSDSQKSQGALSETSEPAGQELLYAARVSLDHSQMQIDDKLVNLGPGMAVTVEIKTGSRSIISYLLSPLLRYQHESLRER